jgi:Methyltransferase domain
MAGKQVDKSNYEFTRYMHKERWSSVWHQIDEVVRLKPESVLEIGPGPGVFKSVAALFGIHVETLDLDHELKPDYIGSATALPFASGSFATVCAFQLLEHLPYEMSLKAFEEMVRVSERNVVISLPDDRPVWRFLFPRFGSRGMLLPRPMSRLRHHEFDGEHYWEINKEGYELCKVVRDLSRFCRLKSTYRNFDNTYHRFFVFEK